MDFSEKFDEEGRKIHFVFDPSRWIESHTYLFGFSLSRGIDLSTIFLDFQSPFYLFHFTTGRGGRSSWGGRAEITGIGAEYFSLSRGWGAGWGLLPPRPPSRARRALGCCARLVKTEFKESRIWSAQSCLASWNSSTLSCPSSS
jgi:hypothetical protein